jgi:hypothetical protein
MASKYRNKPCAYCGVVTGRNTGDHVVPKSFYTTSDDHRIQRIKVSCCLKCNQEFSRDEGHFRAVLTIAGPVITPERKERWKTVERSFTNPISGYKDLIAIREKLVSVDYQGTARFLVYPAKDERVVKIVKKIVCGLGTHDGTFGSFVLAGRMSVEVPSSPLPLEFEADFEQVVPNVVSYLAHRVPTNVEEWNDPEAANTYSNIHSIWILRLLSVSFMVIVQR